MLQQIIHNILKYILYLSVNSLFSHTSLFHHALPFFISILFYSYISLTDHIITHSFLIFILSFFLIPAQKCFQPFYQFIYYITHFVVSCISHYYKFPCFPEHNSTNNPSHFIFSHNIFKYISNHSVNSFFSHTPSFSHAHMFFHSLIYIYFPFYTQHCNLSNFFQNFTQPSQNHFKSTCPFTLFSHFPISSCTLILYLNFIFYTDLTH